MKKYLFVVPSLSKGGAERVVSILSSELCNQANAAVVVTHFKADSEYSVANKVKVICLSGLEEKEYRAKISPFYLVELAYKLRKVINKEQPDFILPFLWTTCVRVDIALLFSKYKRNVIQTVRNNPYVFPHNGIMRKYRDFLVKRSRLTLVQNEDQKAYFPCPLHNKIAILPNPVSNELFEMRREIHRDDINIVGVGRLEIQKNFKLLIRAFAEIHKDFPETRLHIYGEGSLKHELQAEIDRLQIADVAELHGRSNSYQEIYGNADIFVLSSDFEGMPNTLLEAMAVGIPVVSTNCPTGPSDIVTSNENGFLVEKGNVSEMAETLRKLMNAPDLMMNISKNAKTTVESKYSAQKIAKMLDDQCKLLQ